MAGVNKVIIVGQLSRDPELHTTQGGTAVCRLSIPTDRTYKNKQDEDNPVQETEWHRVTVWGKQAEMCAQYLRKGREVYVEGRLKTSSYEKKEYPGAKFFTTEIVAETVQFLGKKPDNEGGGQNQDQSSQSQQSTGASTTGSVDPDDDIPF